MINYYWSIFSIVLHTYAAESMCRINMTSVRKIFKAQKHAVSFLWLVLCCLLSQSWQQSFLGDNMRHGWMVKYECYSKQPTLLIMWNSLFLFLRLCFGYSVTKKAFLPQYCVDFSMPVQTNKDTADDHRLIFSIVRYKSCYFYCGGTLSDIF